MEIHYFAILTMPELVISASMHAVIMLPSETEIDSPVFTQVPANYIVQPLFQTIRNM